MKLKNNLWNAPRIIPIEAWAILTFFIAVDVLGLSVSRLSVSPDSYSDADYLAVLFAVGYCVPQIIILRIGDDHSPSANTLRSIALAMMRCVAFVLFIVVLGLAACVFNVLTSRFDLPLQDAHLAAIDAYLGFDWLRFLAEVNSHEHLSHFLVTAYHSPDLQITLLCVLQVISSHERQLSEFIWLFAVTLLVVCVIGAVVPAVGGYWYYHPPRALFSNFSELAGSWHVRLYLALRSQSSPTFGLDEVRGLVQFPSFHTALAIITAYALRNLRYVAPVALVFNLIVIVSTVPEGGHYLIDVMAGAVIAVAAIVVLRARVAKSSVSARKIFADLK